MFAIDKLFPDTATKVHFFVDDDGVLWVKSVDLCAVLGFDKAWQAVQVHAAKYQKELKIGAGRPALYVSEAGFYKMLFASKAPIAARFQDWVCEEVLPQLRKSGSYQIPPKKKKSAPMKESGTSPEEVIAQLINHMAASPDGTTVGYLAQGVNALMRAQTRNTLSPVAPRSIADRCLDHIDRNVDNATVQWSVMINKLKMAPTEAKAFRVEVMQRCPEIDVQPQFSANDALEFVRGFEGTIPDDRVAKKTKKQPEDPAWDWKARRWELLQLQRTVDDEISTLYEDYARQAAIFMTRGTPQTIEEFCADRKLPVPRNWEFRDR